MIWENRKSSESLRAAPDGESWLQSPALLWK